MAKQNILTTAITLVTFIATISCGLAAERHSLHGHVPAITKHLQPVGEFSPDKKIKLAIGLPLHNKEALTNLLQDIYNPASANFRHYIKPVQFTKMFGPTADEYQSVLDFARTNGLQITGTHPNRMVVDVAGSVPDVERAFKVKLKVYQHPKESRTFFAPDVEPSVAAGLPVLDVNGLNNFIKPRPKFHKSNPTASIGNVEKVGTGPGGGGFMGSDFRAAYVPGFTNTGVGQSVALVEFDGYYRHDIFIYETNAHISTNISLNNILVNGFSGVPSTDSSGGNEEVALDIEMAISMAPGLDSVYVYEEDYPGDASTANTLLNRIATDDLANQISCSWVVPINETSDNIFQEYALQGQSFFDASGDDGAYIGDVLPPSDDPYLTQVGGTILTTSAPGGHWVSETTWQQGRNVASSGGVSDIYPIPDWQKGISVTGTKGSRTMRNFPDVAMVAENNFVVADNGQFETFGGTSCAAPLWAGFAALVNQKAAANSMPSIGFINPVIYAIGMESTYNTSFHDITTGNNFNVNCPSEFVATTGYDLCTGFGTPTGTNLVNALLAPADALLISPLEGFTAAGPVGGPFNVTSQSYDLFNNSGTGFNWSSFRSTNWLNLSVTNGTLQSDDDSTVTVSLNAAASNLVAGVYVAGVWFTNQTTHLAQRRQFTLSVGQPVLPNGGFETGDFSFWLLTGDDGMFNFVDNSSIVPIAPHTGKFFAALGQSNLPLATLSQTLATLPNRYYTISYWLINPNLGSGTIPNEFKVSWNGTALYDQSQIPAFTAWTNMQFLVHATDTTTTLQFGFRNDRSDFGLDDVSVTLVPITPPTVAITSPKTGAVISNASYTITGTAIDKVGVANVYYQINGSDWQNPDTTNNWTNWNAAVTLAPGTNFIRAYAIDNQGNSSTNQASSIFYVVTSPLSLGIQGKGSVTPNDNNVLLEIGKSYTLTATPSNGFGFNGWTGDITTNKAVLTFLMSPGLSLTANFIDVQKPVLALIAPKAVATVSNAALNITGTASDNLAVASVQYQLNNGGWQTANTANNGSNWNAQVTLVPGTNIIVANATDTSGNVSSNHSVSCFYSVATPLHLSIVGKGAVTPNDNGVQLLIGRSYTLTAKPSTGFGFANWSGGISANTATLTFLMQLNLSLTATFVDVTKPILTISTPVANQKVTNANFNVTGKASDNVGVQDVYYQINGLGWNEASTSNGFTNWSVGVILIPGTNTVQAFAADTNGNQSATASVKFDYSVAADWAPNTLMGMTGQFTPVTGMGPAFKMSFSTNYFSLTGTDTNYLNYGVGIYGYDKTGTNSAQLLASNVTPPTVTSMVMGLDFLFTNANGGTFSNTVTGQTGAIKFSNAGGLLPASISSLTLTVTNSGKLALKLHNDNTFVTTNNPPASGNYEMTQYSPISAMLTLNYMDNGNNGNTAYLQLTFNSTTNGTFYGTVIYSEDIPPTFSNGSFTVP